MDLQPAGHAGRGRPGGAGHRPGSASGWRLRNQLELEAVLEELTALLPRKELQAIYEEATLEPYSFSSSTTWKPRAEMFYKRWEERFVIENGDDPEPSGGQDPGGRPGLRQ